MNVVQLSARDINLTSRQATGTLATSQLTLLDGRSIYLDFFGLILWDFIPTNPNDIKQIEPPDAEAAVDERETTSAPRKRRPAYAPAYEFAYTGVVRDRTTVGVAFYINERCAGTSPHGRASITIEPSGVQCHVGRTGRTRGALKFGVFLNGQKDPELSQECQCGRRQWPAWRRVRGGIRIQRRRQRHEVDVVAYANTGTSQPKFDARVDQELTNARRRQSSRATICSIRDR
jgi:hypothetical protein